MRTRRDRAQVCGEDGGCGRDRFRLAAARCTFGITSIDLAEVLHTSGPVGRSFVGVFAAGGTTAQGFTTDGVLGMQTFPFHSTFVNPTELRWGVSGSLNVQLDNLVLTPEPATAALLGIGLAALAVRRGPLG